MLIKSTVHVQEHGRDMLPHQVINTTLRPHETKLQPMPHKNTTLF